MTEAEIVQNMIELFTQFNRQLPSEKGPEFAPTGRFDYLKFPEPLLGTFVHMAPTHDPIDHYNIDMSIMNELDTGVPVHVFFIGDRLHALCYDYNDNFSGWQGESGIYYSEGMPGQYPPRGSVYRKAKYGSRISRWYSNDSLLPRDDYFQVYYKQRTYWSDENNNATPIIKTFEYLEGDVYDPKDRQYGIMVPFYAREAYYVGGVQQFLGALYDNEMYIDWDSSAHYTYDVKLITGNDGTGYSYSIELYNKTFYLFGNDQTLDDPWEVIPYEILYLFEALVTYIPTDPDWPVPENEGDPPPPKFAAVTYNCLGSDSTIKYSFGIQRSPAKFYSESEILGPTYYPEMENHNITFIGVVP